MARAGVDRHDDRRLDLHKGAGDPVDRAASRFVAIHRLAWLTNIAKLHFEKTQKIRG